MVVVMLLPRCGCFSPEDLPSRMQAVYVLHPLICLNILPWNRFRRNMTPRSLRRWRWLFTTTTPSAVSHIVWLTQSILKQQHVDDTKQMWHTFSFPLFGLNDILVFLYVHSIFPNVSLLLFYRCVSYIYVLALGWIMFSDVPADKSIRRYRRNLKLRNFQTNRTNPCKYFSDMKWVICDCQ